jgi:hypothetical protein
MSDSERDPNAYKTNLTKRFIEKKTDGTEGLSEKAVDYVYRGPSRLAPYGPAVFIRPFSCLTVSRRSRPSDSSAMALDPAWILREI